MRRWLAQELAKNDRSLLAFWPLQQDSKDYSGRGNYALPQNGCGPTSIGYRRGFRCSIGANIDGAPGGVVYLTVNNPNNDLNFTGPQPFTVASWVYVSPFNAGASTGASGPIISNSGLLVTGGWAGWEILVTNYSASGFNFKLYLSYDNSQSQYLSSATLNLNATMAGKWLQVVMAYDGSMQAKGVRWYINGKRVPVNNIYSNLNSTIIYPQSASAYLGHLNGNNIGDQVLNTFTGAIGPTRVYDRMLSGAEANELYQTDLLIDRAGLIDSAKLAQLYLYLWGHQPLNNNISLYTGNGYPSAFIPMYITPAAVVNSTTFPLFVLPNASQSGNIPLFIQNVNVPTGPQSITLFTAGPTPASGAMNLFIAGPSPTPASGWPGVPLTAYGVPPGVSGVLNSIPLFMQVGAKSSQWTGQMNLAVPGYAGAGPTSSNMNLFTQGSRYSLFNSAPLSLLNTQSGATQSLQLTMWGQGGLAGLQGGLPFTGSMNLYLNRPTDGFAPLTLWSNNNQASGMTLYVNAGNPLNTPLYWDGPNHLPGLVRWFDAGIAQSIITDGAASFNGVNQFLSANNSPTLQVSGSFTWMLWFNQALNVGAGYQGLIQKWSNFSNNNACEYGLWTVTGNGNLAFTISNGSTTTTVATSSPPATGVNHYGVMWHDAVAQTINLQLDNGPIISGVWTGGTQQTTQPVWIGKTSAGNPYIGSFDSVGFWNTRALSSGDRTLGWNGGSGLTFNQLPPSLASGLTNWYDMNEETGTRFTRTSTGDNFASNNGVNNTAGIAAGFAQFTGDPITTWNDLSSLNMGVSQSVSAKRPSLITNATPTGRNAISYDGIDDFHIGSGIGLSTQFTAFVIEKPSLLSAGGNVILGGSGTTNATTYQLEHDNTNLNSYDGSNSASVAHGMSVNNWYLTGVRRNGTVYRFYKNGAQLGTDQTALGNVAVTHTSLGAYPSGSAFYGGPIAEVLLYNRPLSDTEASEVMNYLNLKHGVYPVPSGFAYPVTLTLAGAPGIGIKSIPTYVHGY